MRGEGGWLRYTILGGNTEHARRVWRLLVRICGWLAACTLYSKCSAVQVEQIWQLGWYVFTVRGPLVGLFILLYMQRVWKGAEVVVLRYLELNALWCGAWERMVIGAM